MDLGHPLGSVAGTLDARVIEALAGTSQSLSGRDVARLSGCSTNGVWKSLRRLCDEGIVLADARRGVTLYTANREHLVWTALEELTRLRGVLIDRIAEEARGWPIQPLLVSLFGSTARGDADRQSDVDLLVLRPSDPDGAQSEGWEDQLSVLRDHIRRWTGNNCQTFQIDLQRLSEHVHADDPIVASWLKDEIRLVGPGIRHYVEEVG
jgi:predicted nucleotidyltransferase/biotin operon repressor